MVGTLNRMMVGSANYFLSRSSQQSLLFDVAEGSSAIKLLRGEMGQNRCSSAGCDDCRGFPVQQIVAETVNAKHDMKVILTSAYSQEMIASSMNFGACVTATRKLSRSSSQLVAKRLPTPARLGFPTDWAEKPASRKLDFISSAWRRIFASLYLSR